MSYYSIFVVKNEEILVHLNLGVVKMYRQYFEQWRNFKILIRKRNVSLKDILDEKSS